MLSVPCEIAALKDLSDLSIVKYPCDMVAETSI